MRRNVKHVFFISKSKHPKPIYESNHFNNVLFKNQTCTVSSTIENISGGQNKTTHLA